MNLRTISFSDGITLAWAESSWIQHMLPSDSVKKSIVRTLLRPPISQFLSSRFEGALTIDGRTFWLADILELIDHVAPEPIVTAIFANQRRQPPRIYIWLRSRDGARFVKLGTYRDQEKFHNEAKILKCVKLPQGIRTLSPLLVAEFNTLQLLVSEGLEQKEHVIKTRMLTEDILINFSSSELLAKGFFGGPIHGDLASNNVFRLKNEILIVDWEHGSVSGPDYCDLIELGSARALGSASSQNGVEDVRKHLELLIGFSPTHAEVIEGLRFLESCGSNNASKIIVSSNLKSSRFIV